MEKDISKFIIEHFGLSTFIMCVIIVGGIALVVWCHNVYLKVKRMDNLPCDRQKEKMALHDNTLTKLETSIEYLTKEIDAAIRAFQGQNIKTDSFTQTNSPLSINDTGKQMMERVGLEDMFNKNWGSIKEFIDGNVKDKNAYDINAFCVQNAVVFPDKFMSEDDLKVLKADAYNTGVPLASYMKVVAVLSRDRYFEENHIETNVL